MRKLRLCVHIWLCLLLLVASPARAQVCDHALDFPGFRSYVDCGPGYYYNDKSSLTVEAWVNLTFPLNQQQIVGNADPVTRSGFSLGVQNGQLSCTIFDSTGTSQGFTAGRVASNTWTHLAFTYQRGGIFRGYINGSMVVNVPSTAFPIGNTGTTDLVIGAAPWNQNQYVVYGRVDEVRIYNFPRTTAQIREDMRLRLPGGAPGLIGYWRFDEGVGTTAQDLSTGNHPGTLLGTVLPNWVPADGPYGDGVSDLQSIHSPLLFPDQGVRIDTGSTALSDTFVVSRISCQPNVSPVGSASYTSGYWVIDQYDTTAGLLYDIAFLLDSGSVDTSDALSPGNFTLYRRDPFSNGAWVSIASAIAASSSASTILFNSISRKGQYMIGSTGNSLLGSETVFSRITVFPVPADGSVSVEGIQGIGLFRINIVDWEGRSHACEAMLESEGRLRIMTDRLPNGCFSLALVAGDRVINSRIIVVH